MINAFLVDIFIFLAAAGGVVWYINTHEDVKDFSKNSIAQQNTQVAPKKEKGPTVPISKRVKIIPLPSGAPADVLRVASKPAYTSSGGFARAGSTKKHLFLPVQRGNQCMVEGVKLQTDLLKQNHLNKYYDVHYIDYPTSSVSSYVIKTPKGNYTKKVKEPWVVQYCPLMCVVKEDQLLTVKVIGNRFNHSEMIAILNQYKNW